MHISNADFSVQRGGNECKGNVTMRICYAVNAQRCKTKERAVVEYVQNEFPNVSWISDRKIYDGCYRCRPDLFLDLGKHIIIVEIDENQHDQYDCSCENKRLMQISQDVGHKILKVYIYHTTAQYNDTCVIFTS